VCSGQHNPWLFLVAVVFAAGTQATVPGNVQGQDPTTSFAGARVRLALRDRPDRWLIGTVVGQSGDSLRLDERDSHAMLARSPMGRQVRDMGAPVTNPHQLANGPNRRRPAPGAGPVTAVLRRQPCFDSVLLQPSSPG